MPENRSVNEAGIPRELTDEYDEELTAHKLSQIVGDITEMWRLARDELGENDSITRLLDDASGLVDTAWDQMRELEKGRDA